MKQKCKSSVTDSRRMKVSNEIEGSRNAEQWEFADFRLCVKKIRKKILKHLTQVRWLKYFYRRSIIKKGGGIDVIFSFEYDEIHRKCFTFLFS